MEYIGLVCIIIFLTNSDWSGKVKKLQAEVDKLKRNIQGGNNKMTKLIESLTGRKCELKLSTYIDSVGYKLKGVVSEADDEWAKIIVSDKNENQTTYIIRIQELIYCKVLD